MRAAQNVTGRYAVDGSVRHTMNYWKYIKFALIAIAIVGCFLKSPNDESYDVYATIGWTPVFAGFVFFPLIVIVGVLILKVIFRKRLKFERPTWASNPLNLDYPERFFHFAGFFLVASGLSQIIFVLSNSGKFYPVLFAPVSLGLGILSGIRVLMWVYEKQAS